MTNIDPNFYDELKERTAKLLESIEPAPTPNETVYRIMRKQEDGDWSMMVSAKGKSTYSTLGAARGALTQIKDFHWNRDREFKIQETEVNWRDVQD